MTGLGRERPTLFLTNHPDAPPREIIANYARHNPILREAALDKDSRTIAWLKRHRIEFDYR